MSRLRDLHCDASGRLTRGNFLDDPHLRRLLGLLDTDGEEARVVGGAVRNALLGIPHGDVDVATTALPDVVVARAKAARFRPVPTGLTHGTVTVVVSGRPFEVTTLREDIQTDGRHAVVRFGRNFALDALRRDFTINALSVGADGIIHDYTGGIADLAAGRVRFIGDPVTRIREDYLRILRFFRFSATYATDALDEAGLAATRGEAEGLHRLSRERIRAELLKLLAAPRAPEVVAAMEATGLLDAVLGMPSWPKRFARLCAILAARDVTAGSVLGLAALAVRDPSAPARLRETLRLSNEELAQLERFASRPLGSNAGARPPHAHTLSALLFAEGRQTAVDVVTLWHVDSTAAPDDTGWQAAARFAAIAAVPALPVSGADIMARGIRSGPLVGRVLKQMQVLWIRAGFPDSPAALHRLLDEAIEETRDEASSH